MNILIDIGHPAHVHLFKNFIFAMRGKGHKVLITVKDKDVAIPLLERYNLDYISFGKTMDGLFMKALNLFRINLKLLKIIRKEKIDIGMGTSEIIAHCSKLSRMKSLIFTEDDAKEVPFFARITYPFADYIITPDCLKYENHGKKHVTHPSYHELAYLHPNNFSPDPAILDELGVNKNERFFILRFNSFKAYHDIGAKGITKKNELISMLEKEGKVFITMEGKIDEKFEKYQINITPEKIHSALFYATMFVGDSQTMTAEASVLGTPALRCNSFVGRLACPEELQHRYGLTYGYKPGNEEAMYKKIKELLGRPNLKKEWNEKRNIMLKEKIDLTQWMINFVENLKPKNQFEVIK